MALQLKRQQTPVPRSLGLCPARSSALCCLYAASDASGSAALSLLASMRNSLWSRTPPGAPRLSLCGPHTTTWCRRFVMLEPELAVLAMCWCRSCLWSGAQFVRPPLDEGGRLVLTPEPNDTNTIPAVSRHTTLAAAAVSSWGCSGGRVSRQRRRAPDAARLLQPPRVLSHLLQHLHCLRHHELRCFPHWVRLEVESDSDRGRVRERTPLMD